jgi:hypothetical protein
MSILHGLPRLNFLLQPSYFLLRFVRRDRSSELARASALASNFAGLIYRTFKRADVLTQ